MNITAEQARIYANDWQKVKAVIETIETTIELAAKCGHKSCEVLVSKTITDEAVNLIREELKRAGFNSEFIRGQLDCDTGFRIYWHEEKLFSFETDLIKDGESEKNIRMIQNGSLPPLEPIEGKRFGLQSMYP